MFTTTMIASSAARSWLAPKGVHRYHLQHNVYGYVDGSKTTQGPCTGICPKEMGRTGRHLYAAAPLPEQYQPGKKNLKAQAAWMMGQ